MTPAVTDTITPTPVTIQPAAVTVWVRPVARLVKNPLGGPDILVLDSAEVRDTQFDGAHPRPIFSADGLTPTTELAVVQPSLQTP